MVARSRTKPHNKPLVIYEANRFFDYDCEHQVEETIHALNRLVNGGMFTRHAVEIEGERVVFYMGHVAHKPRNYHQRN